MVILEPRPPRVLRQTLLVFTICQAMSGSGAKIGMELTQVVVSRTLEVLHLARTACAVAAIGASPPGVVGRRAASGAARRSATATAASAS